jgi:hypothetical protein
MAARKLSSLTAADLDRSVTDGTVRGALKAIRHFQIESGPAPGTYTAVVVKVPVSTPREADHREICDLADTEVEVS